MVTCGPFTTLADLTFRRSVWTAYAQPTVTRPGPQSWPCEHRVGYCHRDGRRTADTDLVSDQIDVPPAQIEQLPAPGARVRGQVVEGEETMAPCHVENDGGDQDDPAGGLSAAESDSALLNGGQRKRSSGPRGPVTVDDLATRMLTTNLDKPGCGWNSPPSRVGLSRLVRRSWTAPDGPDLATDQKVGGSSSSERATVPAGQHVDHDRSVPSPVEVTFLRLSLGAAVLFPIVLARPRPGSSTRPRRLWMLRLSPA